MFAGKLNKAIRFAEAAGYLGDNVCSNGRAFNLEVRLDAGAYIRGEKTALLESLEGKRGLVRSKPPLPAIKGLFGQPRMVNNVLSLAAIPFIMVKDAKIYADYGMGRSLGTLAIQLAREDVGHHNALDKLIGACIREQGDTAFTDGFALMSNRASFEMVHKSASVGISSLVAVSAPTALAIREACNSGMNLIGFARPGCHVIYPQNA